MTRVQSLLSLAIATAIAALLLLPGCSGHDPSAPGEAGEVTPIDLSQTEFLASRGGDWESGHDSDGEGTDLDGAVREMVPWRHGGEVNLDFCTLQFPEGALASNTFISMEKADRYLAVFEFGPHGIEFEAPVRIVMDLAPFERYMELKDLDPEDMSIAWYNESTRSWEALETFVMGDDDGDDDDEDDDDLEIMAWGDDAEGGTKIYAYTDHFSRYALAD